MGVAPRPAMLGAARRLGGWVRWGILGAAYNTSAAGLRRYMRHAASASGVLPNSGSLYRGGVPRAGAAVRAACGPVLEGAQRPPSRRQRHGAAGGRGLRLLVGWRLDASACQARDLLRVAHSEEVRISSQ